MSLGGFGALRLFFSSFCGGFLGLDGCFTYIREYRRCRRGAERGFQLVTIEETEPNGREKFTLGGRVHTTEYAYSTSSMHTLLVGVCICIVGGAFILSTSYTVGSFISVLHTLLGE